MSGVLSGFEDRECVELAAMMGVRLPIADNVPSRGEVEAFLREHSVR